MGSCHIIAMCLKGSLSVELTLMNLLYVIGVTCRALVQSPILEDGERENKNGAPREIRTPDPQIRSLMLYPAEL
jgi:hypothetical protein